MILIQDVSTKGISESTNFYVESRLRGFLVQMRDISKVKKAALLGRLNMEEMRYAMDRIAQLANWLLLRIAKWSGWV
jgi:hypothetical protein